MINCTFAFKHLAALDSIENYAKDRVTKLEKFNLHKAMKAHFIFSVQKSDQIAEITVDAGGHHFEAHATDTILYAAIDAAVDKLERQLQKEKEKITDHHASEKIREIVDTSLAPED